MKGEDSIFITMAAVNNYRDPPKRPLHHGLNADVAF